MPEFEFLWENGPRLKGGKGVFPLSTDSVLLWSFTSGKASKRIMDLGCGGGVLMVLLGAENKDAVLEGVDINPAAADTARENLAVNRLSGTVFLGDIKEHRQMFTAGAYDLVVSNPPYFAGGASSPDPARSTARSEDSCGLEDVCTAAGYLCKWGGRFTMVHRPERLSQIFCAMTRSGLEPKRLRMVHSRPGASPSLVLIEAKRGAKTGLSILPGLILHEADGSFTEEHRGIYRA